MSDAEKLFLFVALAAWRSLLAARHRIPDHLRIAMIAQHDPFITGQV